MLLQLFIIFPYQHKWAYQLSGCAETAPPKKLGFRKITLLRVIPTMAFCLTYILAFNLANMLTVYLAFYLANMLTFYLAFNLVYTDILSETCSDILSGIVSNIYSDILSGIQSDVHSDILSCIYSGILSDIYSAILSGKLFWHTFWRLKSSGAHCARTLADAVQRCSLRSDPGG